MWIVTTHGFLSIVEDRNNKNKLHVRARVADDITAHFPRAKVVVLPGADYRYRAHVRRRDVARMVRDYVMRELTYESHFKDIAKKTSPTSLERSNAYYDTWTAMARMQDYAPYSTTPRSTGRKLSAPTRFPFSYEHIGAGFDDGESDDDDGQWGMPDWDPQRR